MNAKLAKLAAEARKHALSQKRVERLADIGRAENQPVDILVRGGAVKELEAEIDRLHHTLNEQAKQIASQESRLNAQSATIKVQAATIANLLAGDRADEGSPIIIEADL